MRRWIVCCALLALPLVLAAEADPRAADLEAFREGLVEYDASFSRDQAARARARRMLDGLEARAAQLNDAEFQLALAEITALADNGHTQLLPAQWAGTFPRLAVRFLIADDGLFIADATSEYANLIGARVAAVEGQRLDALRSTWSRYTTGSRHFRDEALAHFLEAPAILAAARIARRPDAVRLQLAGGREVLVGTTDAWPAPQGVWALLPPARVLELARAGRIADDPLYLREPDRYFRLVPLPAQDAVYLQFRGNVDFSGRTDLAAEATAAIEKLRETAPRHVIVDQRFNIGGDLNTTRDLMQAIPEIVGDDGRILALVSGRTFSAGISSLGYLRQAAGPDLVIIGEPIGDRLEFWAEGDPLELPSGIVLLRGTERHDYRTGCPETDCHDSIRIHPIRVPSLDPEFRPVFTYRDVVEGRDPYLDAALALIDDR